MSLSMKSKSFLKINQEYLELVPRAKRSDYQSLKNSIKENGQQVAIICNEDGIILDGHTRFQACEELHIKPKFVIKQFDDPVKEREFVVTVNLARRHLTLFGRAEVCFNFYKKLRDNRYERSAENNHRTRSGLQEKKETTDHSNRLLPKFAKMIGTTASVAHQIVFCIENADEQTKQLLRTEKRTARSVYKEIKNPNWKPLAAYGTYLVHPRCLNCNEATAKCDPEKCHVHTQMCCTKCGWGN